MLRTYTVWFWWACERHLNIWKQTNVFALDICLWHKDTGDSCSCSASQLCLQCWLCYVVTVQNANQMKIPPGIIWLLFLNLPRQNILKTILKIKDFRVWNLLLFSSTQYVYSCWCLLHICWIANWIHAWFPLSLFYFYFGSTGVLNLGP
jgi:hypothetical protein